MTTTSVFASLLVASAGAVPGPAEAKLEETWLTEIKNLAQQVRSSDLIIVGNLRIAATRDGHVGTIHVSEVLFGKLAAKDIHFISEPWALEGKERIWFLTPEQTGGTWRLRSVGAAASEKDVVRWLIAKIKNPKQGS